MDIIIYSLAYLPIAELSEELNAHRTRIDTAQGVYTQWYTIRAFYYSVCVCIADLPLQVVWYIYCGFDTVVLVGDNIIIAHRSRARIYQYNNCLTVTNLLPYIIIWNRHVLRWADL